MNGRTQFLDPNSAKVSKPFTQYYFDAMPSSDRKRPAFNSVAILPVLILVLTTGRSNAQPFNGFDVSNATINTEDIRSGGPPRDGIPSIDDPKFTSVGEADFMSDDDIVVGVKEGNVVRAYPLRILVWHEIVNDQIGDRAIAVTYCPLCGTAMVFDRVIDGRSRSFGVSGLLYQSDVLMYDRETESLWSQLAMKAVSGPSAGNALSWLTSEHLTWKVWKSRYPNSEVLSTDTGHNRRYSTDAYSSYFKSDKTMFPVPRHREELSEKSWVIGVIVNGVSKAYAVDQLEERRIVNDQIGGVAVEVRYDAASKQPQAQTADGTAIPSVLVYWFAWQAFYPETELWSE